MKLPSILKDEARDEAYTYFDRNIRPLPKTSQNKIDVSAPGLSDNDVDAFRHAYVSGVFAREYNEKAAEIFGQMQELSPIDLYSNENNPGGKNMDLWNNSIGRKYGLKAKDRQNLLILIHQALKNGELILMPEDQREYKGAKSSSVNSAKSVIVLREDKNGRNEIFYDINSKKILTLSEFVSQIRQGQYPDYTVKIINGIPTPVSNPDNRETNNLT